MKTEMEGGPSFLGLLVFAAGSIFVLAWGALLIAPLYVLAKIANLFEGFRRGDKTQTVAARGDEIVQDNDRPRLAA
ncbi:MAG TPA: hypothetical protein VK446_10065 [Methylocystis sp.]|nr:hypothetical protein [Methylocystis sp.]